MTNFKLLLDNISNYNYSVYGANTLHLSNLEVNKYDFQFWDSYASKLRYGDDITDIYINFTGNNTYSFTVTFKDPINNTSTTNLTAFKSWFTVTTVRIKTGDINITGNVPVIYTLNILDVNGILLYTLNSEDKTVNKTLTFVTVISGDFKQAQDIKNPVIDISTAGLGSSYSYNYVYVQAFKRYYYIDNVTLISKDLTRLTLSEDVLMSFKDLILLQTAFVTRNENSYSSEIYDAEVKYDYAKTITRDSIAYLETIYTTNETTESSRECFLLTTIGA